MRCVVLMMLGLATPAVCGQDAVVSRIAFGSCADQDKPVPIFAAIVAAKPDVYVTLGDTVYCDLDKSRKVTTEVIREKYDTLAKLPGWQALRATCPVLGTWDDHDYGINDAGVEWVLKDESQRHFHDFYGTPPDSPLRKQQGVYHAATFGPAGKRVQVILLDTRYFRTALKHGGPTPIAPYGVINRPYVPQDAADATYLGAAQWAWLADRLKEPAEVRLIGSSIQVLSDEHPFEKWANMPAERAKLYQLVRDTGANGVVILSGDRHLGELSLDTEAVGYPLYDLTASGLNQASKRWRPCEPNRRRVAAMPFGDHFGLVTIDWSADPTVKLELKDAAGETTLKQTVPVRLLQKPKAEEKAEADPKLPDGYLKPADALKKVGEEVKVQFRVKGGRAVNNGARILLNSDKDFRSKENLTVVVNSKAHTGKFEKATYDTFKDKLVRATGKVTLYKDAAQIQVDDAAMLELVEDAKEKK